MNTELIYTALFERLKTIEGFTTVSRRLRHFNMVPATERPALFLTQGNQTETPKKGLKAKIILEAELYVYVSLLDGEDSVMPQLNELLDKIRVKVAPDYPEMCEYQTLGGIVEHCWLEGTIEIFEAVDGMLDNQAIATIPLKILTTN